MKPLIIANWKCNPMSQKEALVLFSAVKKAVVKTKGVEVVICPPIIYVSSFRFQVSELSLGSQDVFYKEGGAFTGEISPLMLKDLKVKYVIVGHSERRQLGETDEVINKKLGATLEAGLKPILCVGEKEGEDKSAVLEKQITEGLKGVSSFKFQVSSLVIAYEPVWAIGTGKNCSWDETMSSILFIKSIITRLYSRKVADGIRVLYGGSVNVTNASAYIKEAGADGLLVGGASLKPEEFTKIIKGV